MRKVHQTRQSLSISYKYKRKKKIYHPDLFDAEYQKVSCCPKVFPLPFGTELDSKAAVGPLVKDSELGIDISALGAQSVSDDTPRVILMISGSLSCMSEPMTLLGEWSALATVIVGLGLITI